jgi:pyruvate, water dikinase
MNYIKPFRTLTMHDIALVGGKNASLGEMISFLEKTGVEVPDGFAVTAEAYRLYIRVNNLEERMRELLDKARGNDGAQGSTIGLELRKLITHASIPHDLEQEIITAYKELSKHYGTTDLAVAVRSSATAEDLPTASFAGQQETYLDVRGTAAVLDAYKRCLASLFTDRALIYRREHGFDDMAVALSVGIQKMVNASTGSAGVMFTLDTETGFDQVVTITSSYGLGELLVQGKIIPDEWYVHKPTLAQGFRPLIKKTLGDKSVKLVVQEGTPREVAVSHVDQQRFSLSDDEVLALARLAMVIEHHYSQRSSSWTPMDIEWAKDGDDGVLYIVQARPETVHTHDTTHRIEHYEITGKGTVLTKGQSIGQQVVTGTVRIIKDIAASVTFNKGDILVTRMTDPDWLPLLKQAGGIITDIGGRTCHAAIVSRELRIPAIIATHDATMRLHDGQEVTLDCSQGATGFVYEGKVPFVKKITDIHVLKKLPCSVLINLADPDRAFHYASLPIDGVGLARLEFIMLAIGIHPMAAARWDELSDVMLKKHIQQKSVGYKNPRDYFVATLAQGIATIAAAFYPHEVVVRLSDFKTNEYKDLLGGALFEVAEENPMLGFRGAVRYGSEHYEPAFALECEALLRVRAEMGLTNVVVMIPFVRTVDEARRTLQVMARHKLVRGEKGLKVFMMVELPSNVILIDQFAPLFDGFSIGSNDLTQLTLGVDRDSGTLGALFDERDKAVQIMVILAIQGAHAMQKYISICGQAPSDFPSFADMLIEQGIDAISLSPDVVISFFERHSST